MRLAWSVVLCVNLIGPLLAEDQLEILWTAPAAGSAAVAFSPDGRRLAVVHGGVELREVADGTLAGTISGAFGGIGSLAFSPDSLQLASGDADGVVRLHQIWNGRLAWSLRVSGDITSVAYGASGILASWSSDRDAVALWRADTGQSCGSLTPYGWSHYSVAFSPDGTLMATGGDADPAVRLRSMPGGNVVRTLTGHTARVRTVAFSADGSVLVTAGDDGGIRLWKVADGGLLRVLPGHAGLVWKVAVAPNATLASCGGDATVRLWRMTDGALLRTYPTAGLEGSYSLEFSPDGSAFAFEQAEQVVVARNPVPAITDQPVRLTRYTGEAASFAVTVTGEGPLACQWLHDGVAVVGATNATLSLTGLQLTHGGVYTVVVTNHLGRIASRQADLSVLPRPMGPGSLNVRFDPTERGGQVGFAGGIPGVQAVLVDPKGRFLVGGQFASVNGAVRHHLARLHPDGTVDPTFQPGLGMDGPVTALARQPDGALLVGGQFAAADGQARGRLVRLDENGAVDPGFQVTLTNPVWPTTATPTSVAVQRDGHVWISGAFTEVNRFPCTNVVRLNTDGTLADCTGLAELAAWGNRSVDRVLVQSDDRVLLAGCWTNPACSLIRLAADGTRDLSFTCPRVLAFDAHIGDLAVHRDGRIAIVGGFQSVNGVARHGVAWLLPDGTPDSSFDPGSGPQDSIARRVAIEPDGRLIVGGWFTRVCGAERRGLARFNTDGTLDLTFDPGMAVGHPARPNVNALVRQSDGRCLVGADDWFAEGTNGIFRLEPDGVRESNLNVVLQVEPYEVRTAAVQADGCALVAGSFTRVNGVARTDLVRLTPEGLLDAAFLSAADPNLIIWALAIQKDGRILVAGYSVGPEGSPAIVRLETDGRLDSHFAGPAVSGPSPLVETVAVQPDGRILIGGLFSHVGGLARWGVARLNLDGSVDEQFEGPELILSDDSGYGVEYIRVLADQRILIAGGFSSPTESLFSLARLQADGTLDPSFQPVLPARARVQALEVQSDGRILLSGPFPDGADWGRLWRLMPDGASDPDFRVMAGVEVTALAVQSDGRVLATTNSLNSGGVFRLSADGTPEPLWRTSLTAGDSYLKLTGLLPLAGGDAFLFGAWQGINGVPQPGLARLNGDASACALRIQGALTPEGSFRFQFTGVAGGRFAIEASPDLQVWQTWLLLDQPISPVDLTDSAALGTTQRFFRARLLP